jgi:hypothetical protein
MHTLSYPNTQLAQTALNVITALVASGKVREKKKK